MTYKYLETWPQSGIPGTQLMIVKICSQVHPLKSQQFQPRFNCARQPWRYFGVPARVARRAALQCASSAIVRVDPDYEPSWSNPAGTALRQLQQDVWVSERAFFWNGVDIGGRAVVLRIPDGTLWVHSPLALTATLQTELDKLGEVKHIVSPNFEHTKYAKQWLNAYPHARLYGCPGLAELRPDIGVSYTLSKTNEPPPEWQGDVQCTWLGFECSPLSRKPFYSEVVFFLPCSRLLIVSDLFWRAPSAQKVPLSTKAMYGLTPVYRGIYLNLLIRDAEAFHSDMRRVLSWNFEQIIPCHGECVATDAKQQLTEFLGLQTASGGGTAGSNS